MTCSQCTKVDPSRCNNTCDTSARCRHEHYRGSQARYGDHRHGRALSDARRRSGGYGPLNVTGELRRTSTGTNATSVDSPQSVPPLVDQSTSPQILTTGIKVNDLICPFLKGAVSALRCVAGTTVVILVERHQPHGISMFAGVGERTRERQRSLQ